MPNATERRVTALSPDARLGPGETAETVATPRRRRAEVLLQQHAGEVAALIIIEPLVQAPPA